nr:eukaryotic translation initiation factor 3 subunit B-like [Tanacetum cinerariifolium]
MHERKAEKQQQYAALVWISHDIKDDQLGKEFARDKDNIGSICELFGFALIEVPQLLDAKSLSKSSLFQEATNQPNPMTVMVVLNIFDVRNGKVIRGLKESTDEIASGVIAGFTGVSWLVIRWGGGTEDKYFARLGKNSPTDPILHSLLLNKVAKINQLEVSSQISNSQIILNMDCETYSNKLESIRDAMRLLLWIMGMIPFTSLLYKDIYLATDEEGLFVGGPLYDDITYRIEASKKKEDGINKSANGGERFHFVSIFIFKLHLLLWIMEYIAQVPVVVTPEELGAKDKSSYDMYLHNIPTNSLSHVIRQLTSESILHQVPVVVTPEELGAKDKSSYDMYLHNNIPTNSLSHVIR